MAEEKPKTADAADAPAEGEEKPKKKLNLKAIILVGGFLVFQVIVVLIVLMFVKSANDHGPETAEAATTATTEPSEPELMEMSLTPATPDQRIRAINSKGGTTVFWGLRIFLQIRKADEEHVKTKLTANENLVRQEVLRIVGESDPSLLEQEADLATIKRQISFALGRLLGKGTVQQVLISECLKQNGD
jgi:flagellar basal body-associated protein FliL